MELRCKKHPLIAHEEDYFDAYFQQGNSCGMTSNETVFRQARDRLNEWESDSHELWNTPKEIWNDADTKLIDAENKEAICEAAATVEPALISGWIYPPTEERGRPEGIVHKIVMEIRNDTLAGLDARLSDEKSYEVCYECQESGELGSPYFFDIVGNYGPSSEGPSKSTITVKIVFWNQRPNGTVAIQQTWENVEFANSVGLHLYVFNFATP